MSDTLPEVVVRYRSLMLERSPGERVAMACGMFDAARAVMVARILAEAPGLAEAELRVKIYQQTYGRDVV